MAKRKYTLEAVNDHYEVYDGVKSIRFLFSKKGESFENYKQRAEKYFNRYWKDKKVK